MHCLCRPAILLASVQRSPKREPAPVQVIYMLVLVMCFGWFLANLTLAVIYERVSLEG